VSLSTWITFRHLWTLTLACADSHKGLGFYFKKGQTELVPKLVDFPELKEFEADKGANKEHVRKYKDGEDEAPKQDFTQYQ
jgi:hypothetical protein